MVFRKYCPHSTGLFNFIIPLGEMAIGLGLILGVLAYTASFFGAFVMINYILADMIFTYPLQLAFYNLINESLTNNKISLKEVSPIKST